MKQFVKRTEAGMNLSDRIWKGLGPHRPNLEADLGLGILEGRSAKDLAADIKKHLIEPEKLFRRVRNAEGKLVLSKAARAYHPGKGVYRSSYKNALRVTATETNIAYRTADFERWNRLPFVTGIEVRLSPQHPRPDICDTLKGKYPKDFKFTGWHPFCICHAVPLMMNDKDYAKLEERILNGEEFHQADLATSSQIRTPPANFEKFMKGSKETLGFREKVKDLKNPPYWYRDNPFYIDKVKPESFTTGIVRDFRKGEKNVSFNIDFAKNNRLDSSDLYRTPSGGYSASRQKLHNQLIDDYMKAGSTKDGTVYMMGGAPANGKSTVVDAGVLPHPKKVLKIDPDEIKKGLPEYNLMVKRGDTTAAAFAHEESSYLSKKIIERSLQKDYDLLIDGVGDGEFDKLEIKIKQYKAAGKRVRADYVSLDTDLSVKLAEARAKKTGREVPLDYILDMNSEISKLIPKAIRKNSFDELYLWDTNINGQPRLILTQIDGKLKVHNSELFKRFLKKAK
jgi:predicted ABC-type ATPase